MLNQPTGTQQRHKPGSLSPVICDGKISSTQTPTRTLKAAKLLGTAEDIKFGARDVTGLCNKEAIPYTELKDRNSDRGFITPRGGGGLCVK